MILDAWTWLGLAILFLGLILWLFRVGRERW